MVKISILYLGKVLPPAVLSLSDLGSCTGTGSDWPSIWLHFLFIYCFFFYVRCSSIWSNCILQILHTKSKVNMVLILVMFLESLFSNDTLGQFRMTTFNPTMFTTGSWTRHCSVVCAEGTSLSCFQPCVYMSPVYGSPKARVPEVIIAVRSSNRRGCAVRSQPRERAAHKGHNCRTNTHQRIQTMKLTHPTVSYTRIDNR